MADAALAAAPLLPSRETSSMSLLDHLGELRRRILYAALGVVIAFFACWGYAGRIFECMQRPITQVLRSHHLEPTLVFTNPTDPFNLFVKVGLVTAVFCSAPFALYQVWLFISPGLLRDERRYVGPFMLCTVSLFLGGGFFGYKIVYPATLDFLIGYGSQFKPLITINEYTQLFMFEFPVLICFLSFIGLVSPAWLWRNIRYSVLAIFAVAAIVSPTPDVLSMCLFAAPLVLLYLLSIGIAWLVHPSRRKQQGRVAGFS
jgi:sec-independent protein translocase protein TatC